MLRVRRPDQTGDSILAEVDEMTAQGRADAIAAIEKHLQGEMARAHVRSAPPVFGVTKDGGTRMLNVDRKAGTVAADNDLSLFTEIVAHPVVVAG